MLTIFGATVVTLMMVFYAVESRSPWFTFAFGLACVGSSLYGWLSGTWPFGVVEAIWGAVAFRKWSVLRAEIRRKSALPEALEIVPSAEDAPSDVRPS